MARQQLRRGSALLGAATLLTLFLQGTALATPSSHAVTLPVGRATILSARPSWATPTAVVGTPASAQQVAIRVGLALRGGNAAQAVADAVSNPASAGYGRYLTPASFRAQFAPTAVSVARVSGFLTSAGLHVTGVASGNLWIEASGTVAQLDRAFNTNLRTFSHAGKALRAPAGPVTIPAAIAPDVTTVSGLSDKVTQRAPQTARIVASAGARVTGKANARVTSKAATPPPSTVCSNYWGQHTQTLPKAYGRTSFNTYICGYSPASLRAAYGTSSLVKKGTDGRGVTVAIIDAYNSPTMLQDANRYAAAFGEPAFAPGQYTETLFTPYNEQNTCGPASWNDEQTLDVEALHGMAPGATIHYVGAQNCNAGIDAALNYVVQHHTADIISNSYGNLGEGVPDEIALDHSIFIQAVAEGIGMYFSSGDAGDNVAQGLTAQPDYQASDPEVTAVGGTSLLLDKHNKRLAETGWETSLDFVDYSGNKPAYFNALPGDFIFGAGGGTSNVFRQPSYQAGTVPAALARGAGGLPMRVVPDLAADADPYTGFYIGETVAGTFSLGTIGGTSLACPLIAGIQAVASQGRRFPIGFANPLLYSSGSSAFHDVIPRTAIHFASISGGYLGTLETGDTQYTRHGYDNITGRGTPNGATFVRAEATH